MRSCGVFYLLILGGCVLADEGSLTLNPTLYQEALAELHGQKRPARIEETTLALDSPSLISCVSIVPMDLMKVESVLAYEFTDEQWLQQALTHPSVDQKKRTNLNYERLEYLGDAVLELVVSRELFSLYPKASEGQLTQMRASIVSRSNLALLAADLGWGEQLQLSPQLEADGGRSKSSILANTFESVIGGVMMDSNYNAARKVCLHLLQKSLEEVGALTSELSNPKGALIELLQSINNEHPTYEAVALGCLGTAPFEARVYWNGLELGQGQGPSKHKAQMAAAAEALKAKRWENKH